MEGLTMGIAISILFREKQKEDFLVKEQDTNIITTRASMPNMVLTSTTFKSIVRDVIISGSKYLLKDWIVDGSKPIILLIRDQDNLLIFCSIEIPRKVFEGLLGDTSFQLTYEPNLVMAIRGGKDNAGL
jgi:hypothetical protein